MSIWLLRRGALCWMDKHGAAPFAFAPCLTCGKGVLLGPLSHEFQDGMRGMVAFYTFACSSPTCDYVINVQQRGAVATVFKGAQTNTPIKK